MKLRTTFLHRKIAVAVAVVFLTALGMLGTTVPRMDLPALVRNSDSIVQGKVEAVEVRVDDKLRLPFTWIRLRVDDPLKGTRRQTIFIRQVGGKAPGSPYTIAISGMPQFQLGDNVIVFLRAMPDGSDTYQVVGLSQGKYEVINEIAVAQISGVELMDPKTGKAFPSGYLESAPVDAFKAKIRELAR